MDMQDPDGGSRTWLVAVDFLSGEDRFATHAFAIDATTAPDARRRAMEMAPDSAYADPRIPDLRHVVHDAVRDGDEDLRALLVQARDALSCCLDDLDSWASTGPEGYTADERRRRDRYDVVLERIDAAL